MGRSAFTIRGEQLIPLLERKRLLDSTWVVCLIAALAGVAVLWFLSILRIDLGRTAWVVFAYSAMYLIASTLTDRLKSPRAVAWAMRSMMIASVIFLGVFWHLVGGLRYPMFLGVFAVPVMISGIMTVGLPGYFVALLSIVVAVLVASSESAGLRWYLHQLHIPVPNLFAEVDDAFGQLPVFPGVTSEPRYDFALVATFSFIQLIVAFVTTPLTALLLRINGRFEKSKNLLGEVQGLFHAILRAEPDPAVIMYADTGQVVQASDTFFQRMLVRPSQLVGKGLFEVIKFEDQENVRKTLKGRHGLIPFCAYKVGPETRIANVSFHRTDHGGMSYEYVAWQELTDVYYLQAAFNAMHEPLMVIGSAETILYANSAARDVLGTLELGAQCTSNGDLTSLLEAIAGIAPGTDGVRWKFRDVPYAVNQFVSRLPGGDGEVCTILWLHSLAREEALFDRAVRDSLTGIYNRRYFDEVMGGYVERTQRGHKLTLAYFDLDDFKGINDTLGHAAGDAALRAFVNAVKAELRDTDVFARRGGDEFAALFVDCDSDVAAAAIERIRASLDVRGCVFEGHAIQVKFSVGLAACRPGDGVEDVIERADRALYQVKQAGKSGMEVA